MEQIYFYSNIDVHKCAECAHTWNLEIFSKKFKRVNEFKIIPKY